MSTIDGGHYQPRIPPVRAAAADGYLPLAVIGHEGGTVLVVLNGLRLLRDPIRRNENKSASPDQVVTVDSISAPVQRHAYRRKIPRGSGVGRQRGG